MKIFKILGLIIFLTVIIVSAGLIYFVSTFDANHYKKQIITLVNKQTGRKLTIDGDLKLAVYPDIAIEMGNTSLSNAAGFTGSTFATIGSAQVSVEVLPLLKKEIKVDEIRLNGLKLNLHSKADGSTNWDDLAKESNANATPKEDKPSSQVVEEMMSNLSIAGVSLKDADIHWRDDQAGQDFHIAPVNLKTGTFRSGKPLPVDLSLVLKQKNPAMTVALDGKTTVTLSEDKKHFSLANLNMHSLITGAQIPNGALDASVSGNITGSPEKITVPDFKLLATLNGDLIPEGKLVADIGGHLNFDVNAQLASIKGLHLDAKVNGKLLDGGNLHAVVTGNTQFDMGKQKLSIPNMAINANMSEGYVKGGAATAKINGNTQFDLAKQMLQISGLKLDATAKGELLQGGNATSKVSGDVKFDLAKQLLQISALKLDATANGKLLQGGKAQSKIAGDVTVDLAKSHIKMPRIVMNTLVEGGPVPAGKLSQQGQGNIDLNWKSKQGAVNLSSLLVKLANLELKGSQVKIQPLAEKPGVSGQFQTNTFNLKQVLKMLGIDAPVTSNPKALSQVQAQFSLKADTENADLQSLKIKLDKTSISGKLRVKNFASPTLFPELTIDSINADDYLAPASTGGQGGQTTASAQSSGNQELLPLDNLRSLNIDGGVKIGSMIINRLKLSKINTRINARQGLIVIDPANASLYKGKYNGRITLDAKQKTPTMKMRHELVGLRSEGLLFDLFQDKYISGGAKLITELSSRGNTLDVLLKNLNGTTTLGFNDGTIRDSKLAEKVSLAVKVFEKKDTKGDKSVVTFTGLSGDWKTTNGVFKTDNLKMLSPYFNITGTGTADVSKQVLDMKLRIGPNTDVKGKNIFAPLHIYGSFSDPKFKLDLKDLIKSIAQADLNKIKQDAKEKLEKAKLEAKQRLEREKLEARQKLDQKKQQLQQKLAAEKAAKEQQLKKKLEDAKANALKKIDKKVGAQVTDKLKEQLGGDASKDKVKEVEDKLKNKLKSGLKGLF